MPALQHNDVYGNTAYNYSGLLPGTGDISADPLFVSKFSNLRLQVGSPCINTGTNAVVIAPPFLQNSNGIIIDLDGNARIEGGTVDIGCYEFQPIPPSVAITSPTTNSAYLTNSNPIGLSGTASDSSGVTQVKWSNNMGGGGTCTGTTSWSAPGIQLQSGNNIITITATDPAGNAGSATLNVDYDLTPPSVAITSPTTAPTYIANSNTIGLSGTASDTVGVTQVKWSNNMGGGGTCTGTTQWSQSGIALQSGDNILTIMASDAAGNTTTVTLTVTWMPMPISIGMARNLSPGTLAVINNAVVTATTIDSAGVTVESADRSSGIELVTNQALSVGQVVSFTGTTGMVGGEYQVNNVTFTGIAAGTPLTSLFMTSKTIGSDLTETLSYVGLNTTGLLVKMAGNLTGVIPSQHIAYVDDGFGYQDGVGPVLGIRIHIPAGITLPAYGYVTVTGISRVEQITIPGSGWVYVNGYLCAAGTVVYVPGIWVRDANDIQVL